MEVLDEILDKLIENDIKIFDHYPVEGYDHEHLVVARDMILHFNSNKIALNISFHVATKPEDAAINILALRELENIKEFYIMESFAYTESGKLLSGNKARSKYEQAQTEKILDKFIKTQSEIQVLLNSKGYKC